MRAVAALALAGLAVGALAGCSDDGRPVLGASAAAVDDTTQLTAKVVAAGIPCASRTEFDPTENISPDGFRYPKPSGLYCETGEATLYLVVYDSTDDRQEAMDAGEINAGLCEIAPGEGVDPDGWFSVVGANWRVATPDKGVIDSIVDGVPGSDRERLSCEFKE